MVNCKDCNKDVDPVRTAWKVCAPLGVLIGGGLASLLGKRGGEKVAAGLLGGLLLGGGAAVLAHEAEDGKCPFCGKIVGAVEAVAKAAGVAQPVT